MLTNPIYAGAYAYGRRQTEETVVEGPKGKSGVHRDVSDPELVEVIRTLAREFSDEFRPRRDRNFSPKGAKRQRVCRLPLTM